MNARPLVRRLGAATLALVFGACAGEEGTDAMPAMGGEAATSAAPSTATPASPLAGMDVGALAEGVVGNSARVQEGDKVRIVGSVRDAELLEELAVQVRRVGAFPLVELASEELDHRLVADVPEQYDAQSPELGVALAGTFDVIITVDYGETPGLFTDIPPERLALLAERGTEVARVSLERGIRVVNLGNEIYPTPAVSRRLGVDIDELSPMFVAALGTDPATLRARGEALETALAAGQELHVTHPNGTDLRMLIAGRPIRVTDGAVEAGDAASGAMGRQVWLPAGEVFLTPVPGTAAGRIVADRVSYEGEIIEGLTLEIEGGRVTSMAAASAGERLLANYEAAGAGKDVFGVVDFGINPDIRLDPSSTGAWVADGFVSLGIGNNIWAGGDNMAGFGLGMHLGGATVTVDGQPIVEEGVLRVQ